MFKKILIANCGDQRRSRAAAKLNRMAHEVRASEFAAKGPYV
jgi:hypothetical protein